MAEKEWSSNYPVSLDNNTSMELIDLGDTGLPSQINSVRNSLIEIEQILGTDAYEANSIRKRVIDLEASSSGNTLDQAYDQGGAGVGKEITANSGAVSIIGSSSGVATSLSLSTFKSSGMAIDVGRIFCLTGGQSSTIGLDILLQSDSAMPFGGTVKGKSISLTPNAGDDATTRYTIIEGTLGSAGPAEKYGINLLGTMDVCFQAASGDFRLEDGYLRIGGTIDDPTFTSFYGYIYTKEISGIVELFYLDDDGNVIQLTDGGSPAGSGSGNTLDQAYDEGGAGAGRIITANSGPIEINSSGDMSIKIDGYISLLEITNPTALSNMGVIYVKDVSGISELFYLDDSGNFIQITNNGSVNAVGSGNTLDQSYDQGGAGAGRIITADSGPVQINASEGPAIEIDGYEILNEISTDPTQILNAGSIYTKDVSGITELFYIDSAGTPTQITSDGYLDTFESLKGVGLFQQASDPSTSPDKGFLYVKDVSGVSELFYYDDLGNSIQLTSGGAPVGGSGSSGSGNIIVHQKHVSSDISQAVSSYSFIDVPNLESITFDALADEYVEARFFGSIGNGASSVDLLVRFDLDGSPQDAVFHSQEFSKLMCITNMLGPLSEGSHTVKVQVAASGNVTLSAYTTYPATSIGVAPVFEVIQFRGSSNPIVLEEQLSDPTEQVDSGILYTKQLDGYTELYYLDDYGLSTQITNKGQITPISIDSHPINPSIYDDEFENSSLDVSWSWEGAGEPSAGGEFTSLAYGSLLYRLNSDDGGAFTTRAHFLLKSLPAGNWTATAKMNGMLIQGTGFPRLGMYCRGATVSDGITVEISQDSGTLNYRWQDVSSGSVTNRASHSLRVSTSIGPVYLRISYATTPLFTISVSIDGLQWYDFGGTNTFSPAFSPSAFGLFGWAVGGNSTTQILASCDWFRVT